MFSLKTRSQIVAEKIVSCAVGLIMLTAQRGWAAAPDSEPAQPVAQICFGPRDTAPKGWISVFPRCDDDRFCWRGIGLGVRDRGGDDSINRTLVFGSEGEFIMGLDNGEYSLELTFGDNVSAHGPYTVFLQGKVVVEAMSTEPGKFVTKTFKTRIVDERLRIKLVATRPSATFAITSLLIAGPIQKAKHCAYDQSAPSRIIPGIREIDSKGLPDLKQVLKLYCDWLVAQQLPNGYFRQNSVEWYRVSYAVRALLAGYDILGEAIYLETATKSLDLFVGQQLPNAAWSNCVLSKPASKLTPEEARAIMDGTTNLADVGCMSTCLAVAYPYVDSERRNAYKSALLRYANQYVASFQINSGAFPNARWRGIDYTVPYSVATGTQAMSFSSLYAISGDENYLRIAERAAEFLLAYWEPDGRPIHHDHNSGTASVLNITDFGDDFYYFEGLLWVWSHTHDKALKSRIETVFGWAVRGQHGLMRALGNNPWWPLAKGGWVNSKSPGILQVLFVYDKYMAPGSSAHEAVRRGAIFLAFPEFAGRVGVMLDPDAPWGAYSIMATGIAVLTLSEMNSPGVIFLKSAKASAKEPASR